MGTSNTVVAPTPLGRRPRPRSPFGRQTRVCVVTGTTPPFSEDFTVQQLLTAEYAGQELANHVEGVTLWSLRKVLDRSRAAPPETWSPMARELRAKVEEIARGLKEELKAYQATLANGGVGTSADVTVFPVKDDAERRGT